MDELLQRGETLDSLLQKSNDLSARTLNPEPTRIPKLTLEPQP